MGWDWEIYGGKRSRPWYGCVNVPWGFGGEREEKRRALCRVFYIAHMGQGKNCNVFMNFFFPPSFFLFLFPINIVGPKLFVKASITKLLPCTYVHPFFIFNQLQLHLCCWAFF